MQWLVAPQNDATFAVSDRQFFGFTCETRTAYAEIHSLLLEKKAGVLS